MRKRQALAHQPQVVARVSIGYSSADANDYQARTERS